MQDPSRRTQLLAEINAHVPPDIDWKQGARDYLSELIRKEGAHNEAYHLIKPFIGGEDFSGFLDEMYRFLDIMAVAGLKGSSRVLDVGCGPGWVSHYLGKLGIHVVGIDISQELLDIAARRLASDPYPAMGEFRVKFLLHDIESEPLEGEDLFDVAIFESVLHHFYDPLSALENVVRCLKPGGLVVIAEGEAPPLDSPSFQHYRYLMERYHTLERPYTPAQLVEMLDIVGLRHHQFYEPLHGWQPKTFSTAAQIFERVHRGTGNNFVVASRSPLASNARPASAMGERRHVREFTFVPPEEFVADAYRQVLGREPDTSGGRYYSEGIAAGRFSRVDVLGRLAYSAEGRQRGRAPEGLLPAFGLAMLYRVPLIGAAANALAKALGLPRHLQDGRSPRS